ncbi:MAG TPA: MOFRL family protein, partial [Actinomycetota bacterium]|nr:MOFRL family protein [Actinomycetota bacterium]
GGATSLAAGPVPGIPAADLHRLYRLLLSSGLDIARMNTVRKRFSRWGAGRLAAALHPADVRVFVVSDVIGDDLAAIGSGPCAADPATAFEVRQLLQEANLWGRLPRSIEDHLRRAEADPSRETPKAGDPALDRVTHEIVAGNRLAVEAAAREAEAMGFTVQVLGEPLTGEAAWAGRRLATALLQADGPEPRCLIAGGETVVKIDPATAGSGGRCQELALAAARELAAANAEGCALLAAGTDGRDGPTDAAGAIVDRGTWSRIVQAGRDPARDLAGHDSHPALDAAGALLKTGLTGTNVMDLVIGLAGL